MVKKWLSVFVLIVLCVVFSSATLAKADGAFMGDNAVIENPNADKISNTGKNQTKPNVVKKRRH